MAVTGKKGVGIPSIILHEGEGTIVSIGTHMHTRPLRQNAAAPPMSRPLAMPQPPLPSPQS